MWATKPMDEILFLHVVRANIPHAPPLLQLFCLIFLYSFLNPAFCELRNPYPGIILFSLFLAILHIKKRYFSKVQSAFPQGIIYPPRTNPKYPPLSPIIEDKSLNGTLTRQFSPYFGIHIRIIIPRLPNPPS